MLVLVALLAGCTGLAVPPPAEPEATPAWAETEAPTRTRVPAPEAPLLRAIAMNASMEARWLKPLQPATASVVVEPGARVAWFVGHAEEDAAITTIADDVFVSKTSTAESRHRHRAGEPAHDHPGFGRSPTQAPGLSEDAPRAMRLPLPGRYVLGAEDARLTVHVFPGAARDAATQATLVEENGRLRFVPDALAFPPGARMQLWSQLEAPRDVREVSYATFLPGEEHALAFTPIDEGLYTLHAYAQAPGAAGAASMRFLVDFERPAERLALGPWGGRLTQGEGGGEERRYSVTAQHPLASLEARFNASSLLPAPASVTVTLERDGETLASASSVSEDRLTAENLPAGRYHLVVRGEHGALVGYDLQGEGRYVLPVPPALAP